MGIYLELLTRGFLVGLNTAFVLPISGKPFPKITAGKVSLTVKYTHGLYASSLPWDRALLKGGVI